VINFAKAMNQNGEFFKALATQHNFPQPMVQK
jgi:hypothetical protein